MIGAPKVEDRSEQPYMGIRTQTPMSKLGEVIPQTLDELFNWLGKQEVPPTGAPFIRYHVIDMAAKLDIELAVPVATALAGNGRISAGVLPAGRYAALIYQDVRRGIEANGALLEWGARQGLKWDQWETEKGDAFGGRVEFLLTGPEDDPDPATWETEVAIRLADG